MKAYILLCDDGVTCRNDIVGVFSNEEKALECAKRRKNSEEDM